MIINDDLTVFGLRDRLYQSKIYNGNESKIEKFTGTDNIGELYMKGRK